MRLLKNRGKAILAIAIGILVFNVIPVPMTVPTQMVVTNSAELAIQQTEHQTQATQIVALATTAVNAMASSISPSSAQAGVLAPVLCEMAAERPTSKTYAWLCAVMAWLEGYDPGD